VIPLFLDRLKNSSLLLFSLSQYKINYRKSLGELKKLLLQDEDELNYQVCDKIVLSEEIKL